MKVSVIISAHGSPAWLTKVLWGYECQTFNNFDVIVAEDGIHDETRAVLNDFGRISNMDIRHISHKSDGSREPRILNKAILATHSDYIIFSNDHCVPRNDFVEAHMMQARRRHFLTGGYFRVPLKISKAITREDIATLFAFDWRWLFAHGLTPTKLLWMSNQKIIRRLFGTAFPFWRGFNSSAWKEDILSINGFNEDLYMGEHNWDFGDRLVRRGVQGISVRESAICIYLDRARDMMRKQDNPQKKLNKDKNLRTGAWAVNGISKTGSDDQGENSRWFDNPPSAEFAGGHIPDSSR
jgi:glycosyltransferase involved in cell wall biosynthesis